MTRNPAASQTVPFTLHKDRLARFGATYIAFVLIGPTLAMAGERQLGAPIYDHATETTYRQVTWDDFQGDGVTAPQEWNRWRKGSFAHIATKIELGRFEIIGRQEGSEWIASAPTIRPYALMNKDFSAVKHGSRNAYTLAHEQLHFDIAETVARRLAVDLAALEGRGSTPDEAHKAFTDQLRESFEAGLSEFSELQGRYDADSAHGMNKKRQKKWAEEIPALFREATEALVAHLEKRPSTGELASEPSDS